MTKIEPCQEVGLTPRVSATEKGQSSASTRLRTKGLRVDLIGYGYRKKVPSAITWPTIVDLGGLEVSTSYGILGSPKAQVEVLEQRVPSGLIPTLLKGDER